MRTCVYGAGGMIGGYLVARLLEEGHDVVAVDIKPKDEWLQFHTDARNITNLNLDSYEAAKRSTPYDADEVYLLAANMGGIYFIEHHPLACILSVDITSSCLKAAHDLGAKRLFYSSSACAYPIDLQQDLDHVSLPENLAWKGRPEYGYGEEKLFSESLCEFFGKTGVMQTRVGRYHNIYAPAYTTFEGGREKAPAAICRKVAQAVVSGTHEIEIWGDGNQMRSFCYIDDCIEGTIRVMRGDYSGPVNIGSEECVTINELVSMVEEIAGVKLNRTYNLDAPQGVRGRNSDNTLLRDLYGWEPSVSLREGLERTYAWIYNEVKALANV